MESIDHNIYKVRNDIFPSNSYILKDELSDSCLLIDPGLDTIAIDQTLTELALKPAAILATHGHFDHIGSAAFFKKKFNIPFYIHENDLKISQSANFFLKIAKINHTIETPKPDFLFKGERETIDVAPFQVQIHLFPGHSAGSCIIQYKNYLFTGDLIYKKGLGLNHFPGEDTLKLKRSIADIFRLFSDKCLILPGHGDIEYLQNIKMNNLELKQFLNKEEQ